MKNLVQTLLVATTIIATSFSFTAVAKVPADKAEEVKARTKERGGKVMGPRVGKKVIKAFDLYNEDKVDEALEILLEITTKNKFDRATVDRYIGGLYAGMDGKGKEAIKYMSAAIEADVLPFKDHGETLRNLGAISMQDKRFEDSIKYNKEYLSFSFDQEPKVYLSIANAHYELKQFDKVIEPAQQAIKYFAMYDKPNQNPYILIMASYYERQMFPQATKAVEVLVKNFPSEAKWWVQLGGFYALIEDNERALSTYVMAYNQGFLKKDTHMKRLAQFYANAGVPYKSAKIQEKYIKSGLIKKDDKALSIMAQTFQNAKEFESAAKYFGEAAEMKGGADLYRKQAIALMADEDYKGAVSAFEKSLDAKPKKVGPIHLGMGEAHFYLGNWKKSYEAFVKAKEIKSSARTAKGWLGFVQDTAKRKGVVL